MNGVLKLLSGLLAFVVAACTANAQTVPTKVQNIEESSLVGDWKGALDAGGNQLHLVLHVTKADSGKLTATLDSVDQGAYAIPVSAITLKDNKLNMAVDAVHGSYEGAVNGDATEIKGTWTQGAPLDLTFVRAPKADKDSAKAQPSDIDGAWSGAIAVGETKLRVVFHIFNTPNGLKATMDSPDQGAKGIPVTAVTRDGATLKIEMKAINGTYNGKISEDKSNATGTWTQGGQSLPLLLKRGKDAAMGEPKRPQNPVRPLPYREEEVSYLNQAQGNTLAGTLTIPQGQGPFTAVLLITGSGPQDRDESLMGHKPFLVLSDWLTRKGIEVLRVDDRGVGKSTGVFRTATTADFATDVEAGVAFLKTRPEVNPKKIGLIGHSEGGIIAPMVAARNPDVSLIVMMAGSGVPGDQILLEQTKLIAEADGESKENAEKDAAKEKEVLALVVREKDSPELEKDLTAKLSEDVKEPQLGAEVKTLTSPWFRYFLAYDPAPALRQVKCPVLALGGEKDLQVPVQQNLPAIRKALEDGGNAHFDVVELPGLNHLFQTAKTGSPLEYGAIEETISPVALEKISTWIVALP
ncbi:MAG TPA: alpha/beta hydrolase [Verrucomicrobiae bacterium]|nr:alpha/beta hydrolase [Verrucomicrobiae bacterium]